MSRLAGAGGATLDRRQRLRLVHDRRAGAIEQRRIEQRLRLDDPMPVGRESHGDRACVLVAGADTPGRSRMLDELRDLMPSRTRFMVAEETWEVLTRAAESRMVVLTDDLEDISRTSLVRLLGRRHPALPVIAVDGRIRLGSREHADAAGA